MTASRNAENQGKIGERIMYKIPKVGKLSKAEAR